MKDNIYKNAFKEVYDILQNTDDELIEKVPQKFITFLQNNMNQDYKSNISNNIEIDKQSILPKTEDILSLIYRSYWSTDEEKIEFSNKDKQELLKIEESKKGTYKDITEIFEERKNINNVNLDNSLMVIKKENFIKRLFNKILNIFS
jgi:hypothetical protein